MKLSAPRHIDLVRSTNQHGKPFNRLHLKIRAFFANKRTVSAILQTDQ